MNEITLNPGVNILTFNVTADTYNVSASNHQWLTYDVQSNITHVHIKQFSNTTRGQRSATINFKACDDTIISSYTVTQIKDYDDIYLYSDTNKIEINSTESSSHIIYFDFFADGVFIGANEFEYGEYSAVTNSQYATVSGSDVAYHTLKMDIEYNKENIFPTEIACNILSDNTVLTSSTIDVVKLSPFVFETEPSKIAEMFHFDDDKEIEYLNFAFQIKDNNTGCIEYEYTYNSIDGFSCEVIPIVTFEGYNPEDETLTCYGEYKISAMIQSQYGEWQISTIDYKNQDIGVCFDAYCNPPSSVYFGGNGDKINIHLTENI